MKLISKAFFLPFACGCLATPGLTAAPPTLNPGSSPYAPVLTPAVATVLPSQGTTQSKPPSVLPDVGSMAVQLQEIHLPPTNQGDTVVPRAAQVVNSKHLTFHYEVKDVGFSGVSGIEVWYTCNGWTWQKLKQVIPEGPCTVEVEVEGTYGFQFLPRTGFGGGKEPPQPGDPAQVWVEVDVTAPLVSLVRYQPDFVTKTLQIEWKATDKNLARKPISLFYAEQSTGPWVPFAVDLDNSGHFFWQITPTMPTNFWLRVEAVDVAGNVGTSDSTSPVRIDLSQPSVTNISIDTAGHR